MRDIDDLSLDELITAMVWVKSLKCEAYSALCWKKFVWEANNPNEEFTFTEDEKEIWDEWHPFVSQYGPMWNELIIYKKMGIITWDEYQEILALVKQG